VDSAEFAEGKKETVMKIRTILATSLFMAVSGALMASSMTTREQANLTVIQEWNREVFRDRQVELGASKYMAEDYITHNVNVPSGRQAFATFLTNLFKDPAGLSYLDARTAGATPAPRNPANPLPPPIEFAKGDFVVMVNPREARDPADPSKTYRYNTYGATRIENGKIKEHWDYALKVAGRTLWGAPDGIDYDKVKFDFTLPERKNVETANAWFRNILQYGHAELAGKVIAPDYIEHDPNIPTGRAALVELFSRTRKPEPLKTEWKYKPKLTIASGPYVFYISKQVEKDPDDPGKTYATYWFDMVRVENGLIQEHWDSAMKNPAPVVPKDSGRR